MKGLTEKNSRKEDHEAMRRRQHSPLEMNMKEMQIPTYLSETPQVPSVQLTLIFSCFSMRLSSLCQITVGRGLPWAPQLRVSESPSRTSTNVGGVLMNTGGAETKEKMDVYSLALHGNDDPHTHNRTVEPFHQGNGGHLNFIKPKLAKRTTGTP